MICPNRLVTFLSAAAACTLLVGCAKQQAAVPRPPMEVGFVSAKQQDVPITGDWVATLDGFVNAQIQPQVSGYLIRQDYREGSYVHKGQVLFEIDPRPFQAALDQSKGQLAVAQAGLAQAQGQLGQSEAQAKLADINVNRDTPLAQARAIAKSQLDTDTQTRATAQATVKTGQAGIESAKANIQSAEAAVRTAQLNLGFTKVLALVDGIAGIATVQIGNLVSQTTVLTTVSRVNPIKAYFPISEQEYLHVAGKAKTGSNNDWLRSSASVPLTLTLADGTVYPQRGKIIFTDRQVDNQTGTIRVVGAFPNAGNILRPGQFGRVSAVTNMQRNALLIPQRAVSELQGRHQVALITAENKIHIQNVTVGDRFQSEWIILNGVKLDDRVVTEGTGKVQEGMPVSPKPDSSGDLQK